MSPTVSYHCAYCREGLELCQVCGEWVHVSLLEEHADGRYCGAGAVGVDCAAAPITVRVSFTRRLSNIVAALALQAFAAFVIWIVVQGFDASFDAGWLQ